jgi:hypothetical protein
MIADAPGAGPGPPTRPSAGRSERSVPVSSPLLRSLTATLGLAWAVILARAEPTRGAHHAATAEAPSLNRHRDRELGPRARLAISFPAKAKAGYLDDALRPDDYDEDEDDQEDQFVVEVVRKALPVGRLGRASGSVPLMEVPRSLECAEIVGGRPRFLDLCRLLC